MAYGTVQKKNDKGHFPFFKYSAKIDKNQREQINSTRVLIEQSILFRKTYNTI